MQIAIDNAKRKFDIDLNQEIARIKKDIDVPSHGLPKFWLVTKRDTRRVHSDAQRRERDRRNKEQIRKRIKEELQCPMNFLYELNLKKFRSNKSTLPMSYFWIKHELTESRRVSKRVESLIQKYSLELHNFNMDNELTDEYLLIKSDFEDLVKEIRGMYISKNYKGLVSWLLNRAFFVGKGVQKNKDEINSTLSKNKSLLMKVLYDVNPSVFLECFKKS